MGEKNTKFKTSLYFALSVIIVLWVVHLFQVGLDLPLWKYGVLPRKVEGLKGIFLSPFIHSVKRWSHIINNSVPLFVSMFIIMYFYRTVAYKSMLFVYLLTGIAVWLTARGYNYHIGASGVVYGLVSFIFWTGVFRRSIRSIILALIMIVLYSGMLAGLFPDPEGIISWESHLAGGLVGLAVAFQFRNVLEPDELMDFEKEAEEERAPEYFLPRDTFEKTKEERERETYLNNYRWFSSRDDEY